MVTSPRTVTAESAGAERYLRDLGTLMRKSADAGVQVKGHPLHLPAGERHARRAQPPNPGGTGHADAVGAWCECHPVAPVRTRRNAPADEAASRECQHDSWSRTHTRD